MKLKTIDISLCGLFAALIVIGAFLKINIPLPLYEMHFTLQWFFVICAALFLDKLRGAISVGVYLIMGLIGIPIFAAGGGIAYVLRPGFGFLLGFLISAVVMGLLMQNRNSNKFYWMLLTSTIGMIIYYTVGAIYFYLIKNVYVGESVAWSVIIVQYCLITVIPDFILCVFASLLSYKIKPILNKIEKK